MSIPESLSTERLNSALTLIAGGAVTLAAVFILAILIIALAKLARLVREAWRIL